ncbi:hypothetical protein SNE35_29900 [Paucibacter sp. R3-3]|uniref:Uncharacterized protein n=1 Tax=Roseateles agri TaxID=3098619 RepID=A0ABU5DR05_9BURK|nr:hypothetical protein [Paucibacter sp. R3-3]MDY0748750.1 hypothetical protein [Paucibacter sp. R3-3]
MGGLLEALLGAVLDFINAIGNFADELRHRRSDDPYMTEQRNLKRWGALAFFVALNALGVAWIVGSLRPSTGLAGPAVDQVLEVVNAVALGIAALAWFVMALCAYRLWRREAW